MSGSQEAMGRPVQPLDHKLKFSFQENAAKADVLKLFRGAIFHYINSLDPGMDHVKYEAICVVLKAVSLENIEDYGANGEGRNFSILLSEAAAKQVFQQNFLQIFFDLLEDDTYLGGNFFAKPAKLGRGSFCTIQPQFKDTMIEAPFILVLPSQEAKKAVEPPVLKMKSAILVEKWLNQLEKQGVSPELLNASKEFLKCRAKLQQCLKFGRGIKEYGDESNKERLLPLLDTLESLLEIIDEKLSTWLDPSMRVDGIDFLHQLLGLSLRAFDAVLSPKRSLMSPSTWFNVEEENAWGNFKKQFSLDEMTYGPNLEELSGQNYAFSVEANKTLKRVLHQKQLSQGGAGRTAVHVHKPIQAGPSAGGVQTEALTTKVKAWNEDYKEKKTALFTLELKLKTRLDALDQKYLNGFVDKRNNLERELADPYEIWAQSLPRLEAGLKALKKGGNFGPDDDVRAEHLTVLLQDDFRTSFLNMLESPVFFNEGEIKTHQAIRAKLCKKTYGEGHTPIFGVKRVIRQQFYGHVINKFYGQARMLLVINNHC